MMERNRLTILNAGNQDTGDEELESPKQETGELDS